MADHDATITEVPGEVLADAELALLQAAAEHTAGNAYAPYSRFRVGAALRLTNGALVTGTNVENMSYGLTICAERAAVTAMVAQYGPTARVAAVCVVNLNGAASPPCGACRQVLAEFMDGDGWVVFPGTTEPDTATGISVLGREVRRFRELLPFGFRLDPA